MNVLSKEEQTVYEIIEKGGFGNSGIPYSVCFLGAQNVLNMYNEEKFRSVLFNLHQKNFIRCNKDVITVCRHK